MIRNHGRITSVLKQFQYVSDLHIDHNKNIRLKAVAPNLIIAGDLGRGWGTEEKKWLRDTCTNFDRVYFTPGNHDYYHNPTSKCKSLREIQIDMYLTKNQIPNLSILMDGEIEHNVKTGAWLIGTTLWSKIPIQHFQHYIDNCSTFKNIYINKDSDSSVSPLTPKKFNDLHHHDKHVLYQFFSMNTVMTEYCNKNEIIPIIISHYAPLIQGCALRRFYDPERLRHNNHAYCTDLSITDETDPFIPKVNLMEIASVLNPVWVFGHTHYRTQFRYNSKNLGNNYGVYLVSNPIGFPNELKNGKGPKVPEKTLDQVVEKVSRDTFDGINENLFVTDTVTAIIDND